MLVRSVLKAYAQVSGAVCRAKRIPEFRLLPGYESRILVVLPAYPVCNHKVRAHGNDE